MLNSKLKYVAQATNIYTTFVSILRNALVFIPLTCLSNDIYACVYFKCAQMGKECVIVRVWVHSGQNKDREREREEPEKYMGKIFVDQAKFCQENKKEKKNSKTH